MSFPSTAPGTRAPLIGVALTLLAVLCFAVLDSSAKYLSQHYPVAMVVWARYAVHTLLMLIAYAPARGRTLLHTRRPGRQLLRALLLLSVTIGMLALRRADGVKPRLQFAERSDESF